MEAAKGFSPLLAAEPGGDTGAPETRVNPIPREWYHTDWVADRTIAYLDSLPTTPTGSCGCRSPIRITRGIRPRRNGSVATGATSICRPGIPARKENIERVLAQKPAHWLALWEGSFINAEGGPGTYRPQNVSDDSLREINAMVHIMNEMIDEACGRVLRRIGERGWDADTDVFFTTDHGELQGDYGLIFKGPFHTDALMRLPMVWRPAPSAGVTPAEVGEPVGQLDLAPTFCEIAGRAAARVDAGRAAADRAGQRVASACCASGTRSSPATACTCGRSIATAGCARRTSRRRSASRTASRSSSRRRGCSAAASARGARLRTTAPKASCTTSRTTRTSGRTAGTIPRARRCKEDLVTDLYDSLPSERTVLKVERPA